MFLPKSQYLKNNFPVRRTHLHIRSGKKQSLMAWTCYIPTKWENVFVGNKVAKYCFALVPKNVFKILNTFSMLSSVVGEGVIMICTGGW